MIADTIEKVVRLASVFSLPMDYPTVEQVLGRAVPEFSADWVDSPAAKMRHRVQGRILQPLHRHLAACGPAIAADDENEVEDVTPVAVNIKFRPPGEVTLFTFAPAFEYPEGTLGGPPTIALGSAGAPPDVAAVIAARSPTLGDLEGPRPPREPPPGRAASSSQSAGDGIPLPPSGPPPGGPRQRSWLPPPPSRPPPPAPGPDDDEDSEEERAARRNPWESMLPPVSAEPVAVAAAAAEASAPSAEPSQAERAGWMALGDKLVPIWRPTFRDYASFNFKHVWSLTESFGGGESLCTPLLAGGHRDGDCALVREKPYPRPRHQRIGRFASVYWRPRGHEHRAHG